jgi:hypothetical protein
MSELGAMMGVVVVSYGQDTSFMSQPRQLPDGSARGPAWLQWQAFMALDNLRGNVACAVTLSTQRSTGGNGARTGNTSCTRSIYTSLAHVAGPWTAPSTSSACWRPAPK